MVRDFEQKGFLLQLNKTLHSNTAIHYNNTASLYLISFVVILL